MVVSVTVTVPTETVGQSVTEGVADVVGAVGKGMVELKELVGTLEGPVVRGIVTESVSVPVRAPLVELRLKLLLGGAVGK